MNGVLMGASSFFFLEIQKLVKKDSLDVLDV
jgi:hypothetical protein